MTDTVGMFDEPPPAPPTADQLRNRRRKGSRSSHRCPVCTRRTFRRIRRYPTLGYEDARCEPCAKANRWPRQHTDRRRHAQ